MARLIFLIVLFFAIHSNAQIENYLNGQGVVDCSSGPFMIGIPFVENVQINFSLNDDERFGFNQILVKNIQKALGVEYTIIPNSALELYKQCNDQKFIIARLDKYQEEYVGGGERSGHITISLLLFNSVKDSKPYKVVTVLAVGKSDYGHSNPLENAISKVGKALREKLID